MEAEEALLPCNGGYLCPADGLFCRTFKETCQRVKGSCTGQERSYRPVFPKTGEDHRRNSDDASLYLVSDFVLLSVRLVLTFD